MSGTSSRPTTSLELLAKAAELCDKAFDLAQKHELHSDIHAMIFRELHDFTGPLDVVMTAFAKAGLYAHIATTSTLTEEPIGKSLREDDSDDGWMHGNYDFENN